MIFHENIVKWLDCKIKFQGKISIFMKYLLFSSFWNLFAISNILIILIILNFLQFKNNVDVDDFEEIMFIKCSNILHRTNDDSNSFCNLENWKTIFLKPNSRINNLFRNFVLNKHFTSSRLLPFTKTESLYFRKRVVSELSGVDLTSAN